MHGSCSNCLRDVCNVVIRKACYVAAILLIVVCRQWLLRDHLALVVIVHRDIQVAHANIWSPGILLMWQESISSSSKGFGDDAKASRQTSVRELNLC